MEQYRCSSPSSPPLPNLLTPQHSAALSWEPLGSLFFFSFFLESQYRKVKVDKKSHREIVQRYMFKGDNDMAGAEMILNF